MTTQTISLDYANSLIFELEKAFWDERGKGARFRLTTVGKQYFCDRCLPHLQSGEVAHVVSVVEQALKEDGVAEQIECGEEGRLLRVKVRRCVHRPVEERMQGAGVRPFTCLVANLLALSLEEKLDRPVELAEITLEDDGACGMLLVLFDSRPILA